MADEDEAKIAAKAHELWEAEGRPDGRAERHWAEASEIVALQAGAGASALTPVEDTLSEPVEPTIALENQADLPVLTDLGDESRAPSRAAAADTAAPSAKADKSAASKTKPKPKRGK